MMAMDFDDQVASAKATVQSSYFGPGTYVVVITGWRKTKNRNGRPFTALETQIKASDDHERHPIGSSASWLQMLDQDMAPPNIKATVMGLLGLNPSNPEDVVQITPDILKKCITRDDPAEEAQRIARLEEVTGEKGVWQTSKVIGIVADVTATAITTRAGKPFTKVAFKYRDPTVPIQALAHRQRVKEEIEAANADPESI